MIAGLKDIIRQAIAATGGKLPKTFLPTLSSTTLFKRPFCSQAGFMNLDEYTCTVVASHPNEVNLPTGGDPSRDLAAGLQAALEAEDGSAA